MKFISEVVLLFNLNFPKGRILFLFLSNHDILILLV